MLSRTATATVQALMLKDTPAEDDIKRVLFEEIVYAHYLKKNEGANPKTVWPKEIFCERGENGRYRLANVMSCWWGFQAGFEAAIIAAAIV